MNDDIVTGIATLICSSMFLQESPILKLWVMVPALGFMIICGVALLVALEISERNTGEPFHIREWLSVRIVINGAMQVSQCHRET